MKTYTVCSYNEHEELVYNEMFSSPKEALGEWFKQNHKHPMMTNLLAKSKKDAIALIEWAAANKELIIEMNSRHQSHIKLNYLLQFIEDKKHDQCKFFYEGSWGDVVFPFCVG